MAKKFKVKNKAGKIVDYPAGIIKGVLSGVGFTGKLLVKATNELFKEAKSLTRGGIISTTNLEKAILRSINNTNKLAMNTAQKFAKKVLK